ADQMYREVLSNVHTPRQMLTAMQIAAEAEDMPAALSLLDRFAKRSSAGSSVGAQTRTDRVAIANAVQRMAASKTISSRALLDLHDHFMAYHIAWANQQRSNPLAALASTSATSGTTGPTLIMTSGALRRATFNYPTANSYFDTYAIGVLRQLYDQF